MRQMDCLANFGPLQPDFNCVKPCQGKMVHFRGVFLPFGGLMGAPGVKAGEFGPPCSESVPTIQWMDCLENFGQKNNIFTLAIFVHFHNYRSTKHFLIDFLQYQKKRAVENHLQKLQLFHNSDLLYQYCDHLQRCDVDARDVTSCEKRKILCHIKMALPEPVRGQIIGFLWPHHALI